MRKSYSKYLKKIAEYIGYSLIILILISITVVTGQKIYENVRIALIVLISCPFMAFAIITNKDSYGKELQEILIVILLLSGLCTYSGFKTKKDAFIEVKSLFIKGEMKQNPYFDTEPIDENGGGKSEYYFELAPNQSKFISYILDWIVFILLLGMPVLTWYIMRKDLK